jgi:hypothetical protein
MAVQSAVLMVVQLVGWTVELLAVSKDEQKVGLLAVLRVSL